VRVVDVAKKAAVSPHTVRYYTKLGLLEPAIDAENGYKRYSQTDLTRLRFITHAKYLGFTLHEIQRILDESEQGKTPCPNVRKLLQTRIKQNRIKIKELQALQRRMEEALKEWEHMPDCEPTGDTVCHLIESVSQTK
jgi:DNA-binding transcriptional MerR regulator